MQIQIRQPETRTSDILPLINIVFLMLIFFLIASTIAPRPDQDVKLAETTSGTASNPPAQAVYLSRTGSISVDRQNVTFETLPQTLVPFLAALNDAPVRIIADKESDGQDLLRIVDAVRASGGQIIHLVAARRRSK